MFDPNELGRMSRRRFLTTLAGIGVSASTLPYLTQNAVAEITDSPKKEVPRLKGLKHTNQRELQESLSTKPKREPIFYTIPRDKWARIEAAHDAANRISSKFDSPHIRAGVSQSVKGHRKRRTIVVRYTKLETGDQIITPEKPVQEVRESLPETAKGVAGQGKQSVEVRDMPIKVIERTKQQTNYFDGSYRPVPGGCEMSNYGKSGDHWCTLATPVWSNNLSERVMLTAGHCLDPNGDIHQPKQGGQIGRTTGNDYAYPDFDAGTIETTNSVSTTYDIADYGGGYDYPIIGVVGWDTIKDKNGDASYQIHRQGATTGRKSGKIVAVYEEPEQSYHEFWIEPDSDGGDSGGPMFRVDSNNDAWIAGVHAWGSNANDGGGNHIVEIENQLGVQV